MFSKKKLLFCLIATVLCFHRLSAMEKSNGWKPTCEQKLDLYPAIHAYAASVTTHHKEADKAKQHLLAVMEKHKLNIFTPSLLQWMAKIEKMAIEDTFTPNPYSLLLVPDLQFDIQTIRVSNELFEYTITTPLIKLAETIETYIFATQHGLNASKLINYIQQQLQNVLPSPNYELLCIADNKAESITTPLKEWIKQVKILIQKNEPAPKFSRNLRTIFSASKLSIDERIALCKKYFPLAISSTTTHINVILHELLG